MFGNPASHIAGRRDPCGPQFSGNQTFQQPAWNFLDFLLQQCLYSVHFDSRAGNWYSIVDRA
jgi:hypothetical protein